MFFPQPTQKKKKKKKKKTKKTKGTEADGKALHARGPVHHASPPGSLHPFCCCCRCCQISSQ
jgi:hypothetical protein